MLDFVRHRILGPVLVSAPSIIVVVILTDETSVLLHKLSVGFPAVSYYGTSLLALSLGLIVTVLCTAHRRFVRKFSYALGFAFLQTLVMSLVAAIIVFLIALVSYRIHSAEDMILHLISMITLWSLSCCAVTVRDYSKNSPRYLSALETVMQRHPSKQERQSPRLIMPRGFLWTDFEKGSVVDRGETEEITRALKKGSCFLVGYQASGKSVIVRAAGYQLVLKGHIVFIVENAWTMDVDRIVLDISSWNLPNVLLIVEDVHRNPRGCSDLVKRLRRLGIKLLLSGRPLDQSMFREVEWTNLAELYERKIEAQVTPHLIAGLIEKHCYSFGVKASVRPTDIESVNRNCGTDLWLVTYLLMSWDPRKSNIQDLTRKNIYDIVYEARIQQWRKIGENASQVMQIASALYTYEIPVLDRYLDARGLASAALKLADEGHLIRKAAYYYLHHASVARIYLEILESYGLIPSVEGYSAGILESYFIESEKERPRVLYNLATAEVQGAESAIVEELVANISPQDMLPQIEREEDIQKIGSFLRLFAIVDIGFAQRLLSAIDSEILQRKYSKEVLLPVRRSFLSDLELISAQYADMIHDSDKRTRAAILTVYNEETLLPYIVTFLRDFADLVVVVDNGSGDRTVEVAKKCGAWVILRPRADMLEDDRNGRGFEWSFAKGILAGIKTAIELNADIVSFSDIYGALHSQAEIAPLIRPVLSEDADLAVAALEGFKDNLQVLNRRAMDAFLRYLGASQLKVIESHGIQITRVLFKKILRVAEIRVPRTYQRVLRRELLPSYYRSARHVASSVDLQRHLRIRREEHLLRITQSRIPGDKLPDS
jgi:hypothetical protein